MISQSSRTHLQQQRCRLFIRAPVIAEVKNHQGAVTAASNNRGTSVAGQQEGINGAPRLGTAWADAPL